MRFHPPDTGHVAVGRLVNRLRRVGGWLEVSRSRVVLLPYTAASVGAARKSVIADLRSAGIFEPTDSDAAIVVSELMTNALRHANPLPGAVIRVCWELASDHVELEVSDGGGATIPSLGNPGQAATSGRGLGIVEKLSRRWGVRQDGDEMTVWAEVPVLVTKRNHRLTHAVSEA
jgi:serine/threonine-protein kinase RsbW